MNPAMRICATRAPKAGEVLSVWRQNLRCFFCNFQRSVVVFLLWQLWQRLSRLFRSVNKSQLPLWSITWSTSVARTRYPFRAHSRQNGSAKSWDGRRSFVQISRLYHRCHCALSFRAARFGLCAKQYPSRVNSLHPGCRQGRAGFIATGYHLRAKQKPALSFSLSSRARSTAPANQVALAMFNFHQVDRLAVPAPECQVICRSVLPNGLIGFLPAVGADNQSVLCS